MAPKARYNVMIDPELWAWAKSQGSGSAVVDRALRALRDGSPPDAQPREVESRHIRPSISAAKAKRFTEGS